MARVIGIDLGTTNSCVAVWDGTQTRVLRNRSGYATTPSIVAIKGDGQVLVGQVAQRQAITNPRNTAYAVKRLIGRPFQSEEVQHARAHVSYPIVAGPGGDPRIVLAERAYACAEISAMILAEMRAVAEESLGEDVTQAVVTVPAYFNDAQRQAVRDAGVIAGLEVLRIINEPTAAAVAYGFGRERERTIAVYDLGGGTFDISIVRCSGDGNFKVLATTGDSFLGGEDFDERIMAWLLDGFEGQHGVKVRTQPTIVQRVRDAAAKAKCDLSELESTEVQLPFLLAGPDGPLNMHYEITREAAEALTWDLVQRTVDICAHALSSIGLSTSSIDEVLLVGGMTRMPLVQRRVAEVFGRTPSKAVNPDEVVAVGAALQGAALAQQIEEISLEDVTSVAIGVGLAGDRFGVLIPANSPVPASVTKSFGTTRDDQTAVRVRVLQGNSLRASENELLHEFELTGLRPGKAGSVTVAVTYSIDREGIFHVAAMDMQTRQVVHVDVKGDSGLSEEEVRRLAEHHRQDVEARRQSEMLESTRQAVEALVTEVAALCARLERWGLGHRPVVASYKEQVAALRGNVRQLGRADLAEALLILEDGRDQLVSLEGTVRR